MIRGTQPSKRKAYPGSVDQDSLSIFDMSVNDTSMYGTYYPGISAQEKGLENPFAFVATSINTELSASINSDIMQTLDDNLLISDETVNGGTF